MAIKVNNTTVIDDSRNISNVGVATITSTLNVGTGGTVITTTTRGSVGVGTTNPTSTLTVIGTFNVSGISTLGVTSTTNLTSQQLNVSGISTLGVTSTTNLTSQQLNVSGISTLGVTSTTNLTSQQLNVSGISTLGVTSTTNLTSQQLRVSGISTLGVTSTTNLTSQQLRVSGISTFSSGPVFIGATTSTGTASQPLQVTGGAYVSGNVGVGTTNPQVSLSVIGNANITGVLTATAFSGDVYNAYPFYSGITSSVYASPTGVLAPIITFPSTSNRRYIVHSINVANKARKQPLGAGATVSINTLAGSVTSITSNQVGTGYTSGDVFVSMGTTDTFNRIQGLVSVATTSFVGVGTTGDPAYAGITSAIGYVTAVSGGAITGVALTYNGFGYTFAPAVTFQSPVGGGTTETGTSTLTLGEVTGAFLNVPGEGYTVPPSISIASTTGVGASITAEVDSDGRVIRLNLLSRGYGYSKNNALGNNEENEVYITLPGLAKTEVAVDVVFDRVPVGGGTTVQSYLAYAVPIPAGGVVEILKQPAVMNPNDQIEIRGVDVDGSGLSNAIDVCISYEETTNTNFIGYGTVTGSNLGLGTAINNIGILSATTTPILLQSLRLTNTEFVGDYDASISVVRPNSLLFNASVNNTISAGSTILFVDNLTNNSLETVVFSGNLISVGTALTNVSIVSVGNTFVTIGTGSTINTSIGIGTTTVFTVNRTTYLARNIMIPSFASIELCDTPKRIEPGNILTMNAETVGIDANLAQTIDIQVSGRNITL